MRRIGLVLLGAALLVGAVGASAQDAGPIAALLEESKAAMMADPAAAANSASQALDRLARAPGGGPALQRIEAQWLKGEALGRANRIEPARVLIDQGLAAIEQVAPKSKLHGDLLMSRGALSLETGDVQRAFLSFQAAHDIFRVLKEPRSRAIALQNIGSIFLDAGDYARVLRYYEQSAELWSGDPALTAAAQNNRGTAFKEMGQYARAEAAYRAALKTAVEMNSPSLQAMIWSNIASAELYQKQYAQAVRSANAGLRLTRRDPMAAEAAPFLWGIIAQAAVREGRIADGIALLEKTFAGRDLEETSFFFRDFHEVAADAYAEMGNDRMARLHLVALKRLDDEARAIRSSTNAALMTARFDFSNQELRISRLKQGQLERDVTIQRARAQQQWILLVGLSVLLVLMGAAYLLLRRSRNRLADSNVALGRALKAKSEFLATTSHEIRTPLNGILGMTQVLLRAPNVDAETRERVQVVHGAGESMKAIVDDILDMARIESGRVVVTREPVELHALLGDTARLWGDVARQKGVALDLRFDEVPRRVVEDGRKLRQIVFNLLSNAVKFTAAGQVTLSARTVTGPAGQRLAIEVSDTGIGIPADHLERIFESFHQVDGGTNRQFSGTGLGLAIARNLAAALEGTLSVTSIEGQGTRFTLDLPLIVEEAAAPVVDAATPGLRMLLVEGNPLHEAMLRAALAGDVAWLEVVPDLASVIGGTIAADVLVVDAASAQLHTPMGRLMLTPAKAAAGARLLLVLAEDVGATESALAGVSLHDAVVPKTLPIPPIGRTLEGLLNAGEGDHPVLRSAA